MQTNTALKSKKLSKLHLFSCEAIKALAISLKDEQIKELDLTSVSLTSMSPEQLTALGALLYAAEIERLILKKNNLGKIQASNLIAFSDGISQAGKIAKLNQLIIEDNELYLADFSVNHWQILNKLILSLPLQRVSLQHNKLEYLNNEQFNELKELIKNIAHPCLISDNHWGMTRWTQIITAKSDKAESETSESASKRSLAFR